MKQPGFITQFLHDLSNVPDDVRKRINTAGGFHEQSLIKLLLSPVDDSVTTFSSALDHAVGFYHDDVERYHQIGASALHDGKVAYCINACEQSIEAGVPNALVRIPKLHMSLLTLKLCQLVGNGPVWIVTTPTFRREIEQHLTSQVGIELQNVKLVEQNETYQLTPDNRIIFDRSGSVSLSGCGMGDLFSCLSTDKSYEEFVQRGGKHIVVVDINNVFATLEPSIVGHHIDSKKKVSCEVVKRKPEEEGSVLVDTVQGVRAVDMKRIAKTSDEDYSWLCTNSYIFDADIDMNKISPDWCRIQDRQGDSVVIRYQKFFDEITAAYDTNYIGVVRGERYMPVKDKTSLSLLEKIVNIDL